MRIQRLKNPSIPGSTETEVIFKCGANEIECTSQVKSWAHWVARSPNSLAAVLSPGYFDGVLAHGLKPRDHITVIAGDGSQQPEDALTRVVSVRDKRVTIEPLFVLAAPAQPATQLTVDAVEAHDTADIKLKARR